MLIIWSCYRGDTINKSKATYAKPQIIEPWGIHAGVQYSPAQVPKGSN